MNEIITKGRDINTITAEIHYIRDSVSKMAVDGAIRIGWNLKAAKELIPHGEWGAWLKGEFDYSERMARDLMRFYEEYGAEQNSLFGEAKWQALADLGYTKALRLIAVPEEEREEFVKKNDVENISTRELEKKIKEYQERAAAAEQESREAHELLEKKSEEYAALSAVAKELRDSGEAKAKAALSGQISELRTSLTAAQAAKATAEKALKQANSAKTKQDSELQAAKSAAEELKKQLDKLKAAPEIPPEVMDKLRAEFAEAEAKAIKRAEAAENQLKMASPAVAVFKVHFAEVQKEFVAMLECMDKVDGEDKEKLRAAVTAVLNNWREAIG